MKLRATARSSYGSIQTRWKTCCVRSEASSPTGSASRSALMQMLTSEWRWTTYVGSGSMKMNERRSGISLKIRIYTAYFTRGRKIALRYGGRNSCLNFQTSELSDENVKTASPLKPGGITALTSGKPPTQQCTGSGDICNRAFLFAMDDHYTNFVTAGFNRHPSE